MVTSVQKVIGSVPVKDLYFSMLVTCRSHHFSIFFLAFFLIYAGF